MPKKNRSYKKGEPFRDATFLIIACEGAKREKIYFETLAKGNQRIKVKILSPSDDTTGHSAPHWLLERAISFTQELGIIKYDTLWFVLDVDRWGRETLETIKSECKNNWSLAVSNPCFEIWLLMHYSEPSEIVSETPKQLKAELHTKIKGGYKVETAINNVTIAIERARNVDLTDHFIPLPKTTKVYLLADQIINK